MKPINPHQSGITGFNPGIATSSLADGGGVSTGLKMEVMNAKMTTSATPIIARLHTQRETSP